MRKAITLTAIALLLASSHERAQERAGSAAIGAVSGAVVLGPVGAVAGAVIGYAAGPEIARSWGIKRPPARAHTRMAKRAHVTKPRATPPPAGDVAPVTPAPGVGGPPVQSLE